MSINRCNISGNLTRDPEMRALRNGTQVLSFGVAVNDRRKNPQTVLIVSSASSEGDA